MKLKYFSLIELLTVIIVILVLSTLMIPGINRLRAKARIVVCANQLKQIGTLVTTYANDHDGRLPYSGSFDYLSAVDNIGNPMRYSMYANWNGHLLPYFDISLNSYSREEIYYDDVIDDITNPLKTNHQVIKDMMYQDGHGPLKIFVCPDASITLDASSLKDGNTHPRVSSSGWGGMGSGNWAYRRAGLPSSYLAHGVMFGYVNPYSDLPPNSIRIEDINRSNLMIAEGCNYNNNYGPNLTFYGNIPSDPQQSHKSYVATFSMSSYNGINQIAGPYDTVLFSYMHDNTKDIWVSDSKAFVQNMTAEFINRFNSAYSPTAAASRNLNRLGLLHGRLATSEYPGEDWNIYKGILQDRKFNIEKYYSEDLGKRYFFGSMNILSADLSVKKQHIGWIYENARELALGNN